MALTVWHLGHIEDKWQAGLTGIDARREAQLELSLDLTLTEELKAQPT